MNIRHYKIEEFNGRYSIVDQRNGAILEFCPTQKEAMKLLRIHAAAPELYEACRNALTALNSIRTDQEAEIVTKLENLISKVEGMEKYLAFKNLKGKYPDALLLIRDNEAGTDGKYICFDEDAVNAQRALDIPVTEQQVMNQTVKSLSFHVYQVDAYLPKLVRHGCRVAMCDALE